MSTGDEKNNFGFIGAMGQALPFALGLSISQPDKKILLITGDGDTLMSLGSLATIANHPVSNLTVIVLDNESYVETGSQPTATAGKTNLELIAKGSGIENTYTIFATNIMRLGGIFTILFLCIMLVSYWKKDKNLFDKDSLNVR